MSEVPETQTGQTWEVTVNSDRITSIGMVLLFFVCCALLVREVRNFFWGHVALPAHLHKNFWSIWDRVFEAIAAVYCLMLVVRLPKTSLRFAFALLGLYLGCSLLLSCVRTSSGVQYGVAIGGSVLLQAALAISCVAIAHWFKSVVHRGRAPKPHRSDF